MRLESWMQDKDGEPEPESSEGFDVGGRATEDTSPKPEGRLAAESPPRSGRQ